LAAHFCVLDCDDPDYQAARNAEIVRLFDNGRGLTHRQIAEKFSMNISAVSMVIVRWNRKLTKNEGGTQVR